jgi:sodium-coupled monocarboxylate transporter 8/12
VTLSLVCSFVSAITLLGNPVEVYFYGTQYTLIAFAFIPMTAALAYLYVPVYFELQLTSAYEYFQWRFSSRLRLVMSIFAMLHLMVYMPTTVWGPSLALEQVAGINAHLSAAMIFLVCIAYSSIGGLKAVLWTDALQAVVMVGALASVVGIGIYEVGGISAIWAAAERTDRVEWFNFDPDPRSRHTFWTATIGGFLLWLPLFAATQAQIQRYNSVPTLKDSRKCLLFNMFGLILVICLCSLIGLMIYAQYELCDPVKAKCVTSPDQLLPLFVLDVLKDYPGIPGLLVAGLTCGSLSTVSSALNSLTAILVEDYVKVYRPGLDQVRLGWLSKIVSTASGLVAFGLVFVIAVVNETIQISPFSTLMHGSFIGPILGAFSLGMFFPWTNDLGVSLGVAVSLIFSLFVGVGNIFAGRAGNLPLDEQKLFTTTAGCNLTALPEEGISSFIGQFYDRHEFGLDEFTRAKTDWKDDPKFQSFEIMMWSISYIWLPGIGGVTTLIFGLIFSAIINAKAKGILKVNKSLLSKPFLRLWKLCFGQKHLDKWVDYDSPPFGLKEQIERKASMNMSVNTAGGLNLNQSETNLMKYDPGDKSFIPDTTDDSDVPYIVEGKV